MKSEAPLDYAVFQLSPRRSRYGKTEKLASGSVKPFVSHLKVAEEQVALAVQSIKLEAEKRKNAEAWFTKGTLERFVRFVSTPEILELVNSCDAEMSQLEAAQRIYSQGAGDQHSGMLGGDGTGNSASADATKQELLRAIDVRLIAVRQDLSTACARASAAGFDPDTVSDLQLFADRFGAHRLNEACTKYILLSQGRPDMIIPWKPPGVDVRDVRSSCESDMSIDGPTENHTGSDTRSRNKPPQQDKTTTTQQQTHLDQPSLSTCQQHKLSTTFPVRQNNVNENEKTEVSEKEENEAEAASTESSSISASQPARRLSVQDRINLFEIKQKENKTSGGNSGGKPVVSRTVELRRLSSDVSSAPGVAEKSVLRRWSGASDMSIDLSGEKKDVESPLCTPSSVASVSQTKLNNSVSGVSEDKYQKGLNVPSTNLSKIEPKCISDHVDVQNQVVFDDQRDLKEKLDISSGGEKRTGGFKDHIGSETWSGDSMNRAELGGFKDQVYQTQFTVLADKTSDVKSDGRLKNRVRDSGVRDQTLIHSNSKEAPSGDQFKGVQGNSSDHQPQWRSFPGELVKMDKKVLALMDKKVFEMDDSGVQKTKAQNPVSAGREHVRKLQIRRDESSSVDDNRKMDFPGKKVLECQDSSSSSISAVPVEQVQRVRQSKGNQELNDELKMKANELEKLFAEHKLRVPVDESGFSRRSKPVAVDILPEQFWIEKNNTAVEPTGTNMEEFNTTTPPTKIVDNDSYGSGLSHNFSELSISDDSRGKFYQKYMQKRDAKLREEWVSKGPEKEAKMKAMQDSLEKSRAEMKAKFLSSLDRQDSISSAQRRAEKLRSFNYRSNMKREQTVDLIQSEEDEDLSQLLEQKSYGPERLFNDSFSGDGASRSNQTKKTLASRSSSLSTPHTTPVSAPRSAVKVSNSSFLRRRGQTENPLAQSVPNFPDLRKENTKPSSGISKTTSRPQVRNYGRIKSALRKGSSTPAEFKDSSALYSEGIVLAPLKFDKEQSEQSSFGKYSKSVESKPFLRKGDGKGIGGAGSVVKLKSSTACETLVEEEFDEPAFEAEDLMDVTNEDEDEGLEAMEIEDANIDSEKPRTSQGSDKSGISGSENGESTRSLSQLDPSSVAELPVAMPSTFHTVGLMHDSPGESPVSRNSQIHHQFSYPHETSDIDASMDSPIGSPASWNSLNLTQADADAARMRKKWGSAQKPTLIVNLSNQSRKDVTKGFKRLLKFGRKSRGTESSVDWISATTSEGDDDTEDGRDPANRSSEDLRKSRMGFSQGPFDDSFNENELFNEQAQALESSIPAPPANFKLREDHMSGSSLKAPRSFFSLSSFRSKGSDSKPR